MFLSPNCLCLYCIALESALEIISDQWIFPPLCMYVIHIFFPPQNNPDCFNLPYWDVLLLGA